MNILTTKSPLLLLQSILLLDTCLIINDNRGCAEDLSKHSIPVISTIFWANTTEIGIGFFKLRVKYAGKVTLFEDVKPVKEGNLKNNVLYKYIYVLHLSKCKT